LWSGVTNTGTGQAGDAFANANAERHRISRGNVPTKTIIRYIIAWPIFKHASTGTINTYDSAWNNRPCIAAWYRYNAFTLFNASTQYAESLFCTCVHAT